jgi:hypothetical protein
MSAGLFEIRHRAMGKVLKAYGECRDFFHVIRGPLGAGKTYESIFKCITIATEQRASKEGVRKSRGIVVRNTYPDLISTVLKDFREVVPNELGEFTMGHPPTLNLDFDLEDGTRVVCEIIFLALDKPDDVRKIRGMNATWAYINEVKELEKANVDMLTARVDRFPMPGYSTFAGVFGDTNAWDKDHWLEVVDQKIKKGEMPGYRIFVQPGAVIKVDGKWVINPEAENQLAVKAGYYQRILPGKREDWIRVNLANEIGYSFDGKPVQPDYSDSRNVSPHDLDPVLDANGRCIIEVGLDFGLTPAATMFQRQGSGQIWGIDELVAVDMNNAEFARQLKEKCDGIRARLVALRRGAHVQFNFRGDPSGDARGSNDGRTTFQVYRAAGIMAVPASTNNIELRRASLERPLTRTVRGGDPAFILSPRMVWLRKALAGAWCYKRVQIAGSEKFKDVADKNEFSHVGESAEYALMDAGEHAVINAPTTVAIGGGMQAAIRPTTTWDPFKV